MAYYNLIFQGKIIDGASLDEVKDNVARLFKADAAKTAVLFSGKSIVIKKNLDTEAAKKYLAVLKKAGAIAKAVKVKAVKLDSETTAPQKETLNKSTPETSPTITSNNKQKGLSPGLASLIGYNQPKTLAEQEASDNLKPVTESTQNEPAKDQSIPVKATPDKSTPNISGLQLAPIGSNHNEENSVKNSENPPIESIPDTSHLSMSEAQSGSLEEFAPEIEAVELPDIDDLSMGEANTGSLEEFSKPVTAVELPDISTLDIRALDDAPLSELSATIEAIEIPDISDLSMSEAQEGSLKGLGIKVDAVAIPDTSHLEIEKTLEKGQANEKPQGKATFQIN